MHEDCRDCIKKISEFMDGETDERTCEKIRDHLKSSRKCRNCLESLEKTVDVCRKSTHEGVPPDARARLRAMIEMCFSRNAVP